MRAVVLGLVVMVGCSKSQVDDAADVDVAGAEFFERALVVDVMATQDDGLKLPRDLAFNPDRPRELWVINTADDSMTRLYDAGTENQTSDRVLDPYALHFQEKASSIAFGAPGTFATCQESRNTYNGQSAPNNFMGPTLWSSDLDVYASSNPDAVEFLSDAYGMPVDLGSHLDMLHESPLCMGIAWEKDNRYWVFDGYNSAISMNDFKADHDVGYDDHSDGEILRYNEGEVSRVKNVPSHLEFDAATGFLYIADTGNQRIAVLDTATGEMGKRIPSTENYPVHRHVDKADLFTLVDEGLEQPSGLAFMGDIVVVSDFASGDLHAYAKDGEWLASYATGRAQSIMGLEVGPDGNLWIADANADEVLRLRPE